MTSNIPIFDYDRFLASGGMELCSYMEGLIKEPRVTVSEELLQRLLSELPDYDEYHLAYALAFGAKFSPATFSLELSRRLAHDNSSVWCTAFNSLNALPDEFVTQDLVRETRRICELHAEMPWIAEALDGLEKRLAEIEGR